MPLLPCRPSLRPARKSEMLMESGDLIKPAQSQNFSILTPAIRLLLLIPQKLINNIYSRFRLGLGLIALKAGILLILDLMKYVTYWRGGWWGTPEITSSYLIAAEHFPNNRERERERYVQLVIKTQKFYSIQFNYGQQWRINL